MNFLRKIDHYLLTNHPVLWRTKVHYFVLFSFVFGNVAAFSLGELLESYHTNTAFIFGLIFLGFSTLFWLISQARNKIKHYRFWDEVLTFGVYVLCALMLYINFVVLVEIPILRHGVAGEYNNNKEILLFGGSAFVFISATTIYLIAHTGVGNILGIILLHFVSLPLIVALFRDPIAYMILFVFLFILAYSISGNSPAGRFIRFFLVPYIPLAISTTLLYMSIYSTMPTFSDTYQMSAIVTIIAVITIFGSALIIKGNVEPLG